MKRVTYIILATIALCGCSTSDEGVQSSESALDEIIISPSLSDQASTKGSIIEDITDLQKETFMLYATAYDYDSEDNSGDVYAVAKAEIGYSYGTWSPTEGHKIYWPTSESDVTFYAWHPASVEPNFHRYKQIGIEYTTNAATTPEDGVITLHKEGNDVVHYKDSVAVTQDDLMYCITTMTNPTQQSVNGDDPDYTVDLDFIHLLTGLRFEYKTAVGIEVRIKAMTLHNIRDIGRFADYNTDSLYWVTYDDFDGNLYTDTRPNYHCVPMKWGNEDFVASTTTAVPISGENDLMVFPQVVTAWVPSTYSIANNDSEAGAMGAYLQIYCDMETTHGADKHGDDVTYGDEKIMTINPTTTTANCIYVPISSKDSNSNELWVAGNIVTYTLTFGAGYDKEGNENPDLTDTESSLISVKVTATLNGWNDGGSYYVEF